MPTATDTEKELVEYFKCQKSFIYFLTTYARIQDRASLSTIQWIAWPYLVWVAKQLLKRRFIIIGKARQLGISWLICIYCVWKAKFHKNAKVLMLSKKEDDAFDLISKCKFVNSELPDFLRSELDPSQRGFVGFPETNSEIRAYASTEDAGRSTDATIVVSDEWEFHPYAEENFAALMPTIGNGGQFIAMSTADKTKLDTFFKVIYNRAIAGESNFFRIFLPWFIRPGRDQEWYDRETADMPAHQREGEYPATEQEMLSTVKSRRFFAVECIEHMYSDVSQPVPYNLTEQFGASVKIYKLPVVGRRYFLFTDPSDGKEDPHVIIVIDSTGEEVAESHAKTTADECAVRHDALSRLYGALNGYEMNSRAGGIFSEKIKELDTPNQIGFLRTDGTLDGKKRGWWTGPKIGMKFWWMLEEAVRLYQVKPRSKECLDELSGIIVPEGEDPQKARGGHDDYIDAFSRVWYMAQKHGIVGEVEAFSFKYR